MKKYIFILSFFVLFFNITKIYSETKDTCKEKIIINTDLKSQVIKKLFDCFVESKFKSLVIFMNNSVEFGYRKDSSFAKEIVTDFKIVDILDDFLKHLPYTRFKIMSGKNIYSEDVFIVRLFASDNDDTFMDIFFILDKHSSIKTIAIY